MVQILSESENSERQISFGQNMYDGVMQHFCIFDQIIGDFVEIGQEILFDDNCSNVELSIDVSTDVDAVQELSDKCRWYSKDALAFTILCSAILPHP